MAASAGEDAAQWAGAEGNWLLSSFTLPFFVLTYITISHEGKYIKVLHIQRKKTKLNKNRKPK